jgi:hypothetical protein
VSFTAVLRRSNFLRLQNTRPINMFRKLARILLKGSAGRTRFVERGIMFSAKGTLESPPLQTTFGSNRKSGLPGRFFLALDRVRSSDVRTQPAATFTLFLASPFSNAPSKAFQGALRPLGSVPEPSAADKLRSRVATAYFLGTFAHFFITFRRLFPIWARV